MCPWFTYTRLVIGISSLAHRQSLYSLRQLVSSSHGFVFVTWQHLFHSAIVYVTETLLSSAAYWQWGQSLPLLILHHKQSFRLISTLWSCPTVVDPPRSCSKSRGFHTHPLYVCSGAFHLFRATTLAPVEPEKMDDWDYFTEGQALLQEHWCTDLPASPIHQTIT